MQRCAFTLDGEDLSFCHWSAEKRPVLLWAHANGFNGETYAPLLAPLQGQFDIYAWDARGHGHSTLPAEPAQMTGWHIYRDDMIALVEHLVHESGEKIWLGGHSMGGCTAILTAAARPDLVAGLTLTDPVIVPTIAQLVLRLMVGVRKNGGHHLMRLARNRQATWPDAQTTAAAYRGRRAFATWQDGFLEAYLRGGLLPITPDDAGNSVRLACDPLWEAANFKGPQIATVPSVKKLRVPYTLLMAQTGSATRAPRAFDHLQVDKKIIIVPGSTHFLPMEFPELVRDELLARAGNLKISPV